MKFDVIISNPPYNRDMYLSFVETAYDLLANDGQAVLITPAKFYAKGGKDNELYRQVIMPHIKEVHVYKDSLDIFQIGENPGIAYYNIYRNQLFANKMLTFHCKANKTWETEVEQHTENPVQFIPNSCLSVIKKCLTVANQHTLFENSTLRTNYYCGSTEAGTAHKAFDDDVLLIRSKGGTGERIVTYLKRTSCKTLDNLDKYKIIINTQLGSGGGVHGNLFDTNNTISSVAYFKYINPGEINKGSYVNVTFCDTELEAQSIVSYYNSQLVYFCLMNSIVGAGSSNKESWRHVPALPAPYKFDHIYTNEEIFKIFQLTPEEIQLITNLIKPRKEK